MDTKGRPLVIPKAAGAMSIVTHGCQLSANESTLKWNTSVHRIQALWLVCHVCLVDIDCPLEIEERPVPEDHVCSASKTRFELAQTRKRCVKTGTVLNETSHAP